MKLEQGGSLIGNLAVANGRNYILLLISFM
jgi:hypothetical protein